MGKKKTWGWFCLFLWAVLIAAGIVAKRVYGHPEWMVFFHLPAALFLVLGWYDLSYEVRRRYRQTLMSEQWVAKGGSRA